MAGLPMTMNLLVKVGNDGIFKKIVTYSYL